MRFWDKIPAKRALLFVTVGGMVAGLILRLFLMPHTSVAPEAPLVMYGGLLFLAIFIYLSEVRIERSESEQL